MPRIYKYPQAIVLKAIQGILDGLEPKDLAWKLEVSTTFIYDIRDRFFKQVWSLKKHPKDTFDLE